MKRNEGSVRFLNFALQAISSSKHFRWLPEKRKKLQSLTLPIYEIF
jgi:hypothetical protein